MNKVVTNGAFAGNAGKLRPIETYHVESVMQAMHRKT